MLAVPATFPSEEVGVEMIEAKQHKCCI